MFIAATAGYPDPLEKPKQFSNLLLEFLLLCLDKDPNKRPSASELLKHEFVAAQNCDSAEDMKQVISGIFELIHT